MGGGSGNDAPQSAPQAWPQPAHQAAAPESRARQEAAEPLTLPEYLQNYVGKGKYNIGFAGPSGCGKSSFLNDLLGGNLARSGVTECTLVPEAYGLPLNDPRGYFKMFIERLPVKHQSCVSNKLRSVTLWDLPGAGTRLHPAATYIRDKGLRYFDFVVLFVGERVVENDHDLLSSMAQYNVKYFLCRSKLDVVLSTHLKEKKDELGRPLVRQEKFDFATNHMTTMRAAMVDELRRSFPDFHGQLYLVAALNKVDDESPHFQVISEIHETRLAFDRLLLDVIEDRHNHNLRHYFDDSLYGHASKMVFNWFFGPTESASASVDAPAIMQVTEQEESATGSDVFPGDSASHISRVQDGYPATAETQWVHLPAADITDSIHTEEEAPSTSNSSFALLYLPAQQRLDSTD